MECSVFGCISVIYAKGFCYKHYEARRAKIAPQCIEVGCCAPQRTKGLCNAHYRASLRKTAPKCKVDGCGNVVVARGLCDAHRLREDHYGHLDPTRPADWGARSRHPLYNTWQWIKRKSGSVPYDNAWKDFWVFVRDVGDKPSSLHKLARKVLTRGYFSDNVSWVEQKITSSSKAEYAREWRRLNPSKVQNSELKSSYGITLIQYNQLYHQQNGTCAICGTKETAVRSKSQTPRKMAVDHCHTTGKVRGLLCTKCNSMIGHANDRTDVLYKAIRYLQEIPNGSVLLNRSPQG